MSKRPSIIAGLTAPAQPEVRIRERVRQPTETSPAATAEPVAVAAPAAASGRRPTPDVVHTSIYLPKAAHRRLKEIALTRDVKVHDLIVEGINSVLEKHGHAAIEPRKGTRTE